LGALLPLQSRLKMESEADLAAKVAEYEAQLADVDLLLSTDPSNTDVQKLRADLSTVLELTRDLIRVQSDSGATAAAEPEQKAAEDSREAPGDLAAYDDLDALKPGAPEEKKKKSNYERVTIGGRPMNLKVAEDGQLEIPENLNILDTDTEAERQKKRKLMKKIRYQNRLRAQEQERQQKQSSWQAFQRKDAKRKVGGVTGKRRKQQSIFATSDGGRVGVTGSGKGMTSFEQRKKYKLNGAD